jgi:preprotein translocase subunit YajC
MQQQQMLEGLHVGDEVLTAGGIYGEITGLRDDQVTLEIAPQLEVRVARRAVAAVIGADEGSADDPDEPGGDGEPEPPEEPADASPGGPADEHGG